MVVFWWPNYNNRHAHTLQTCVTTPAIRTCMDRHKQVHIHSRTLACTHVCVDNPYHFIMHRWTQTDTPTPDTHSRIHTLLSLQVRTCMDRHKQAHKHQLQTLTPAHTCNITPTTAHMHGQTQASTHTHSRHSLAYVMNP